MIVIGANVPVPGSVTTVTQIYSEEDSSSTAGSSLDDRNQFSSSFLNANFAHTASFYGTSAQSRDRFGSLINDQGTAGLSSHGGSFAAQNRITSRLSATSHTSGRAIPSLSSSIPYSVPNSNKDNNSSNSNSSSLSSSWLETYAGGMPNNISAIDSNVISSPKVDSVEPRFVISKQKLQKASMDSNNANATQSRSISRSGSFSSQLGNFFFSKSQKNLQILTLQACLFLPIPMVLLQTLRIPMLPMVRRLSRSLSAQDKAAYILHQDSQLVPILITFTVPPHLYMTTYLQVKVFQGHNILPSVI